MPNSLSRYSFTIRRKTCHIRLAVSCFISLASCPCASTVAIHIIHNCHLFSQKLYHDLHSPPTLPLSREPPCTTRESNINVPSDCNNSRPCSASDRVFPTFICLLFSLAERQLYLMKPASTHDFPRIPQCMHSKAVRGPR